MSESKASRFSTLLSALRACRIYLPVFFLALLGLDLVFRYAYQGHTVTAWNDVTPLRFSFCWCALLTALAWLLPGLAKKIYMAAAALFYVLLVLVHCGKFSFFGSFFTFSDVRFAGDGADFFSLDYIYIRKLVIAAAVLCLLAAAAAILLTPKERYTPVRLVAALALLGLSLTGIRGVRDTIMTENSAANWDSYLRRNNLYDNFTDINECLMLTGLYQYTFRDFCLSNGVYELLKNNTGVYAALDEWYAEKIPDPDNGMTGAFAGRNLILIQLEAIDTWMINDICMPTLTAVKNESIDFTNHFAPMYLTAGTFNTENVVNTGLVSPFVGGSTAMYTRNDYPLSAARLFRAAGYAANSFHNSDGHIYDRATIHRNWGYERYYSGFDIGMANTGMDSDLMSGYELMVNPENHFFTFIITISGHGAYEGSELSDLYYDKFASLLPQGADEMIVHAYAHAWETDRFIAALLERLEADGYLENTVLAFYSDHYNYYVVDDALIMEQKNVYDRNLIQQTAFFIYAKDAPPQKITKVTSTIDVLPTLANLFGLDTDGRYYVGNDAFSENGGYVIFKDYSWYDGERYWNSAADTVDSDFVARRNEELRKRLSVSWDTMTSNYFHHAALP